VDLKGPATLVYSQQVSHKLSRHLQGRAIAVAALQLVACSAASCGFQRGASLAASINTVCSQGR
jgi:hypothetical protein